MKTHYFAKAAMILTAAALLGVACRKQEAETVPAGKQPETEDASADSLKAFFAEPVNRTAFIGSVYSWMTNDRIRVAAAEGGTIDFKYSGLPSAGAIYLAERGAIRRITHSAADYSDAVVTTILGGGSSYITAVGATAALDWNNGGQDIIFDPSDSKVFYYTDMRYTLKKVTIE